MSVRGSFSQLPLRDKDLCYVLICVDDGFAPKPLSLPIPAIFDKDDIFLGDRECETRYLSFVEEYFGFSVNELLMILYKHSIGQGEYPEKLNIEGEGKLFILYDHRFYIDEMSRMPVEYIPHIHDGAHIDLVIDNDDLYRIYDRLLLVLPKYFYNVESMYNTQSTDISVYQPLYEAVCEFIENSKNINIREEPQEQQTFVKFLHDWVNKTKEEIDNSQKFQMPLDLSVLRTQWKDIPFGKHLIPIFDDDGTDSGLKMEINKTSEEFPFDSDNIVLSDPKITVNGQAVAIDDATSIPITYEYWTNKVGGDKETTQK